MSPNRRDDLMFEQLDYTRLATEREAALAELEAKQAGVSIRLAPNLGYD